MAVGEFHNCDSSIFACISRAYIMMINHPKNSFTSIHDVEIRAEISLHGGREKADITTYGHYIAL